MSGVGWVGSVGFDVAEVGPSARFWAALVGGEIAYESDEFASVNGGSLWIAFDRVDGYRPPVWPDGDPPQQVHVDLAVDDLDVAEAQVLALGAVKHPVQPRPGTWRVFLDPAGHPFCLNNDVRRP